MSAQRQNAPAWPSDISKQQLQNRCRANNLHSFRVLSPADGITNCSGLLRTRCRRKSLRHFQEHFFRYAAIALHHLGRVAREVSLHNLKDTARMLKRSIPFELGSILRFTAAIFAVTSACFGVSGLLSTTIFRRSGLVQPAFRIVFSLLRFPSGA